MPLGIVFAFLTLISLILSTMIPSVMSKEAKTMPKAEYRTFSSGSSSSGALVFDERKIASKTVNPWLDESLGGEPRRHIPRVEDVESALLRTCRQIDFLARMNSCSWRGDPKTIWAFVLDAGGIRKERRPLSEVVAGSKSDVFQCGDILGDYGRYVLGFEFPSEYVTRFGVDLRGIDEAEGGDPCGIGDIVYGNVSADDDLLPVN